MIHPIFSTVLGHPELIADHVANYGALIRQEAAQASRAAIARVVAGVLAAVSAMLALGLIGIAVMLGVLQGRFHWVLAVVPSAALLIAVVAGYLASRPTVFHAFADLREQVDADMQALHAAGEHRDR
jgi:fatty acid desaturase